MSFRDELLEIMVNKQDHMEEYITQFKAVARTAAENGNNFVVMHQPLEDSVSFIKWLVSQGFLVNYSDDASTLTICW